MFMVGCLPAAIPTDECCCHSSPSSGEIKNERGYTATPRIRLHGVYRDNFTEASGGRVAIIFKSTIPKVGK